MSNKYNALLICACGCKEELDDAKYIRIMDGEERIQPKCGHSEWTTRITAKHWIDPKEWKLSYGSAK